MNQSVYVLLQAYPESLAISQRENDESSFQIGDIALRLLPIIEDDGPRLSIQVTATTVRELPLSLITQFESYKRDIDAGHESHRPWAIPKSVIEWSDSPTPELTEYCAPIAEELRYATSRLIQLIRWRCNRTNASQPLERESISWSFDRAKWYVWPGNSFFSDNLRFIDIGEPLRDWDDGELTDSNDWDDDELTDPGVQLFQQLLTQGSVYEPLGRQLLLDAFALQGSNPRASVALAVAAAEISLKGFVSSQSSSVSESWLLSQMSSLPLQKLIKADYLGWYTKVRTVAGEEPQVMPKAIRRGLQKAIECRNRIIHSNGQPPSPSELSEYLAATNDFLYALDWFSGEEWALNNIREEVRKEWDLEEPEDPRN
jgi:hypothetical protein